MSVRAPAPTGYSTEVSARLESLIGLDPRDTLEKLRAAQQETAKLRGKLADIRAKLAMLEARHGYPSHWEHERKALLARLKNHERDRLLALGERLTEGLLEDYAHAHGEYRSFLSEGRRERESMEILRDEVARINDQIEVARGVETYYDRHARLNDALIYHSGREMGL